VASTAPQDNGGSLRKSIGLIELFTFWTCEPIRPAQAFQIGSAGGIIGKNPLKIGKRCWKAAGVHSGKLSPIHRIGNKPDRQGIFFQKFTAGEIRQATSTPLADRAVTGLRASTAEPTGIKEERPPDTEEAACSTNCAAGGHS